jgi:LCP family protein required for cell wall assembly
VGSSRRDDDAREARRRREFDEMIAAFNVPGERARAAASQPKHEREELSPTLILPNAVRGSSKSSRTSANNAKAPAKSTSRNQSKPPKRRKRRWLKWSLITASVLLLAGAGLAAAYVWNLWSSFDSQVKIIDDVFDDDTERPDPLAGIAEGAQTILLLGSDLRVSDDPEVDPGRFDTMMVVHVPADRKDIVVMSIMRDNWVEIPGHGNHKINAAMPLGGLPLVVKTIEGFIDTRIDHVAIVDFQGFSRISTALGGVTVDNPRAFTARTGDFFAEGEIVLKGKDALTFVRERKAFIDGDYTRVKNQQLFIKGMLGSLMSMETLGNPFRIKDVVDSVSPYLQVDADFNLVYIAKMAFELRELRASDVTFFTSPTLGTGWAGNQSVVLVDWDGIAQLRTALREGTLVEFAATLKK